MRVAYLTTSDNPFDPYLQFDQWYAFDERNGYHSCQLLDRCAKLSNHLSIRNYNELMEQTIDSIISNVPLGVENVNYKKVVHEIKSLYDEDDDS